MPGLKKGAASFLSATKLPNKGGAAMFQEINQAVSEQVEAERLQFAPGPDPETGPDNGGNVLDHEGEPVPGAEVLKALQRNEDGDAELFVTLHSGRLVYDHAANRWYTWTGHHWEEDGTEEALAGVNEVADRYHAEMKRQAWIRGKAEMEGKKKQADRAEAVEKMLARRVRDLQTVRRKQAVLHLARAGAGSLGITGDEWDQDPWSLAVENGVIDLQAGTFRPGTPGEYLRTFAPTPWEGVNAPCRTWEATLESTFGSDGELVAFVGRLAGYAITGKTIEAVMPILWGTGRNGKTVFLQALADVLGPDLAGPVEAELLLESRFTRQSGGPSSDLLYLRGRRLAWLSETNENRRLNAGKVKLFTGGDFITGRAPYAARQITFKPTHKIFLLTNHRPKADAQDVALWRRVLLIPFESVFVSDPDPTKPQERIADLDLAEKLKAERPGILAWLVKGCLAWQRDGLNAPGSVLAATQKYKDDEDTIKMFLLDCCAEGPSRIVRAGEFYEAYKKWCEENGEKPGTNKKFGQYVSERYDGDKDNAGKFYMGVGLSSHDGT